MIVLGFVITIVEALYNSIDGLSENILLHPPPNQGTAPHGKEA